ncbi:MAG TPA: DUF4142 domain-containing protein [Bryobacteraceae bacterium]|nr:DUF4142 domain-containing protein [Bryobacteraceae bacterium]
MKIPLVAILAMAAGSYAGASAMAGPESQKVLGQLAQASIAEVQLGHLAQAKSTNPVVKKFAGRMIEDHTALLKDTQAVASRQNVALPTMPTAQDTAEMNRLRALSGKNFDAAYINYMLQDHRNDINMLSGEKPALHDRNVYSLVQRAQPILENHVRAAENVAGELGLPARPGFNQPVHPSGTE